MTNSYFHWTTLMSIVLVGQMGQLFGELFLSIHKEGEALDMDRSYFAIETYSNISVRCTNSNNADMMNGTSHINFKPSWPTTITTASNISAAQRTYINVTRSLNGTLLQCSDGASRSNVVQLLVGDSPGEVECIVFNRDSMTCQAPSEDTGLHTSVDIYWKVVPDCNFGADTAYPCPVYETAGLCSWPDGYKPDALYIISVNYTNALNPRGLIKQMCVDTRKIVKPDKVSDIEAISVETRSVTVEWESPDPKRRWGVIPLRYKVLISTDAPQEEIIEISKSYTFTNLHPYSVYTVTIRCTTMESSIWSDPNSIQVTTKPDVPGANPFIPDGAFHVDSKGHKVTIYWLPLAKEERNGNVTYRVMEGSTLHRIVAQPMVSLVLDLHTERTILVEATTSQGPNTILMPSSITIPAYKRNPVGQVPYVLQRLNDITNDVTIIWEDMTNATEYHVFWCQKKGYVCDISQNKHIKWDKVHGNETSYILAAEPGVKYRVAVGVTSRKEGNHRYSGMHWGSCIFQSDTDIRPPSINLSTYQTAGSCSLEWKKMPCEVTHLFITYRKTNEKHNVYNATVRVFGGVAKHTVSGLEEGAEYSFMVYSLWPGGQSTRYTSITSTIKISGLTKGGIALVIVGVLVAAVFIILGIHRIYKKTKEWGNKQRHVPIRIPERQISIVPPPTQKVEEDEGNGGDPVSPIIDFGSMPRLSAEEVLLNYGIRLDEDTEESQYKNQSINGYGEQNNGVRYMRMDSVGSQNKPKIPPRSRLFSKASSIGMCEEDIDSYQVCPVSRSRTTSTASRNSVRKHSTTSHSGLEFLQEVTCQDLIEIENEGELHPMDNAARNADNISDTEMISDVTDPLVQNDTGVELTNISNEDDRDAYVTPSEMYSNQCIVDNAINEIYESKTDDAYLNMKEDHSQLLPKSNITKPNEYIIDEEFYKSNVQVNPSSIDASSSPEGTGIKIQDIGKPTEAVEPKRCCYLDIELATDMVQTDMVHQTRNTDDSDTSPEHTDHLVFNTTADGDYVLPPPVGHPCRLVPMLS